MRTVVQPSLLPTDFPWDASGAATARIASPAGQLSEQTRATTISIATAIATGAITATAITATARGARSGGARSGGTVSRVTVARRATASSLMV